MKIALTGIHVIDPIAAFKFYTETLGFTEQLYMPEHLLAIVKSPEQPDGAGLLLEPDRNPIAKAYRTGLYNAGIPVLILGSENIFSDYERLSKLNVVFKAKPEKNEWGIDAFFDDTCGNWIQIHQENE
ncbi:MAG: VOC family protein [Bacteroidales bacterium]|nr:VOC family protein [Bacteroidales bacterium]